MAVRIENVDVYPTQCVIVGASLEGLLCAYYLQTTGHHVVLVDKGSGQVPAGQRGFRAPPNIARLLFKLPGVESLFQKEGHIASGLEYIEGSTSRSIGYTEFFDQIMSDLGSQFYTIPHNVLFDHILELCQESGVNVRFNTEVISMSVLEGRKSAVHTSCGDTIHGDIIIGADGSRGICRTFVSHREKDAVRSDSDSEEEEEAYHRTKIRRITGSGTFDSLFCGMSTLAGRTIEADKNSQIQLWMETDIMVLGAMHGHDLYKVVLMVPSTSENPDAALREEGSTIPEEVSAALKRCDSLVRELVELALHYRRHCQPVYKPHPNIEDTVKSLVLLGDAGIESPFYGIYSDVVAVEGAFTLARLFSRLSSPTQIPHMLEGYRKIRVPRNLSTIGSELEAAALLSLPPGPEREVRDAGLALHLDQVDEAEAAAQVWATTLAQFDYDAIAAVDEWWQQWGIFMTEGKGI